MTSSPSRIVIASANPDKAKEIDAILREVLGDSIVLLARPRDLGDIEETGSTLLDNARLKAVAVCEATGCIAVGDDTGLEVDALDGAPGVYSARYAGEQASYVDNVAKLLEALSGADARGAQFRTAVIAAFPDGHELIADGAVRGVIARQARGANGFGYDSVFIPEHGDGRSFAELTDEKKNALSHRGKALRSLAAMLVGDIGSR